MIVRTLALLLAVALPEAGWAAAMPRYDHFLVIVAENQSFQPIMSGNATPMLQKLAKTYGLAANYFGVVHPSEGNYVALVGGDTFGIHDDDAYYCKPGSTERYCDHAAATSYPDHTIHARSLVDQLDEKGLSWKGYDEDIPAPGSSAIRDPDPASPPPGRPGGLYAVKHNGFMNFARVQDDPKRAEKIVGFDRLDQDLESGAMPAYAQIVPNQCNDMHGLDGANVPPDCAKGNEEGLRARGDAAIGRLADRIMASSFWPRGNNALVIVFDEDGKPRDPADPQGCCGFQPGSPANFGGGHTVAIVITNHGPRGIVDPTPYNHYSLLRTTETAFGIEDYLNHAGDPGVVAMEPLFRLAP